MCARIVQGQADPSEGNAYSRGFRIGRWVVEIAADVAGLTNGRTPKVCNIEVSMRPRPFRRIGKEVV